MDQGQALSILYGSGADRHAETLLQVERRVAKAASGPLRAVTAGLLRELELHWPGDGADDAAKRAVVDLIAARITEYEMAAAGAQSAIVQGAGQAYELSAHTAAGQVGDVIPGGAAGMLVPVAIATAVAEQIRAGQALARASQTKAQLVTAVSAGAVSATRVERAATYWVVDAATRAFVDVQAASEQAVARVWHAERDACVACLAYAGHYVSSPAGRFPAGLTYGDRPITPLGDIMGPPLHPGCRCSLSLVHVDVVNDLSDALKREAQRSVLRGWSLPSESEAVRLRAAEALLKQGNSLPKSVQDYAARAVSSGSFGRGRDQPA
jgi:hypothetical protein